MSLSAEVDIPREIIDDYLTGMKNSFGVPKERREELEKQAVQEGIAFSEGDPTICQMLRGRIREIGDAEAVHKKFVREVSQTLLEIDSSETGQTDEIFDNLDSTPSGFDGDISEMLRLTINEASVCYKHECYLATIVLCGKIIETLLANAFQTLIGKTPPEKMGFGEIRKALRGKGMPLEDSVDELLELIYTHRSIVVHHSSTGSHIRYVSYPTKEQAMHLAGLTQVVINTIYDYFNSQADLSENSPNGA